MKRTWTLVGQEVYAGDAEYRDEAGQPLSRDAIAAAIEKLDWLDATDEHPMLPGLALKSLISALRIPRVSHIAYGRELAPYGVLGVEGAYKNGRARVYAVDRGHDHVVVATDFWPTEE